MVHHINLVRNSGLLTITFLLVIRVSNKWTTYYCSDLKLVFPHNFILVYMSLLLRLILLSMVVQTAFKFPEQSSSDVSLYLFLQGSAVIGFMPVLSKKMDILGHVPLRLCAFNPLLGG